MNALVNRLFGLSGAVALVTGSSAGIGSCARPRAGRRRARRSPSTAARRKRSTRRWRRCAPPAPTPAPRAFDVTDRGAVGEAVERVEAEFGPIDILVNNAGIQRRGPLEDYPEETWRELMRANLDSVFFVSQAVARTDDPAPARQDHQHRLGPVRTRAPEHRALHGVEGRGEDADQGHGDRLGEARAAGSTRSRRDTSRPNSTRRWSRTRKFSAWLTGRTPMGRWGDVDELVGAAIFLASDASSFVNGHILYVDGGITACL